MASPAQIAHYKLTDKLGEGGMGAVYRATDTKLHREVAVKILPDVYAADPDRLARFTREAQALAALNHPNIAAIYGVEERALIMELVEGEELKGPLPLETALQYARQIADALEAAHDKGIVHRDLKPANIKVTPERVVKVLDFGLAAMTQPSTPGMSDPANSPTLTLRSTQAGVIMGTAGYMSPEQASGKPVDRRADIWSFGVVLYEMLMGKTLFEGETVSHTLASVLKDPIDFEALQAPRPIREMVKRCLERDPRNRMQAIGEARIAIQTYLANPQSGVQEALAPQQTRRAAKLPWIAAAALGTAAAVFAFLWLRPAPPPRVMRFEIHAPSGSTLSECVPAPSPDGTMIAYTVRGADQTNRIYLRPIDKLEGRELAGTEEVIHFFWSPDSKSLAFTTSGKLKRIEVAGGAPRDLADVTGPWHGSWSPDGYILFTNTADIARVPAEGGPVTKVITGGFPESVDSRRFLFYTDGSLSLATLGSQKSVRVLESDGSAVVARTPGGKSYLLFLRSTDLLVQPFDERSGTVKGNATVLVGRILRVARALSRPAVGVSPAGILAYQNGAAASDYGPLVWVDRAGKVLDTLPLESSGLLPDLSPDGLLVALTRKGASGEQDLWVTDLTRRSSTRLTFASAHENFNGAAWSPDGKRLASRYSASNGGTPGAIKVIEVANPANIQAVPGVARTPHGWSPDGKMLLAASRMARYSLVPVAGDGNEIPVGSANSRTAYGQFSPDGRYIAFSANDTGRLEIYVQPTPPGHGIREGFGERRITASLAARRTRALFREPQCPYGGRRQDGQDVLGGRAARTVLSERHRP